MNINALPRAFVATDGRYELQIPTIGTTFALDRLRTERDGLIAELTVRCALPGVRTYDGILSAGDFNVSSVTARTTRANLLEKRSGAGDVDWAGCLEELCLRTITAEREGADSIDLRDVDPPAPDDTFSVLGFTLPRSHPAILFGDGGSAKSYLGLYILGRLAQAGVRVGLFDWELDAADHRSRLGLLFGDDLPPVEYTRCDRALVHDVDRLRRIVRLKGIEYGLFDSVGFAAVGAPETAEAALGYFAAARRLGIGGIHTAHITKAEGGDRRPFGSAYWHNSARATWFLKRADESSRGEIDLGVFQRKANLGEIRAPFCVRLTFRPGHVQVLQTDAADVQEFAQKLPLAQRIRPLLAGGPLTIHELAEELDANADSIEKALKRGSGKTFQRLDGHDGVARWGNRERVYQEQAS